MRDAGYLFAAVCLLFIPAATYLFSFQKSWADAVWHNAAAFIAEKAGAEKPLLPIASDTMAHYIMTGLLLIIALLFSFSRFLIVKKTLPPGAIAFLRTVLCYYLAVQLALYGTDKVFGAQFYKPQPNILYTPFGMMTRDLLYWSTMGSSYGYNLFLGSVELLAALLLLVRRTRLAGILLSTMVVMHIVAVNFSFDISVKLLSCFLAFICFLLLAPYGRELRDFFFGKESFQRFREPRLQLPPFLQTTLKVFVVAVLLFEAVHPFMRSKPRPLPLTGAYAVIQEDSTPQQVKRFFIHPDGFLIFQYASDSMQDYRLSIDTGTSRMFLVDYQKQAFELGFHFNAADSVMEIRFPPGENSRSIRGKALDWEQLPALQPAFHWTIESVK